MAAFAMMIVDAPDATGESPGLARAAMRRGGTDAKVTQ